MQTKSKIKEESAAEVGIPGGGWGGNEDDLDIDIE